MPLPELGAGNAEASSTAPCLEVKTKHQGERNLATENIRCKEKRVGPERHRQQGGGSSEQELTCPNRRRVSGRLPREGPW